jgi:hypothetical protein
MRWWRLIWIHRFSGTGPPFFSNYVNIYGIFQLWFSVNLGINLIYIVKNKFLYQTVVKKPLTCILRGVLSVNSLLLRVDLEAINTNCIVFGTIRDRSPGLLKSIWTCLSVHQNKTKRNAITNGGRGRCGRDRMVVGFITTYVISAYHHWRCEFESRSGRGVQHYVIKFVLRFPPPMKLIATI